MPVNLTDVDAFTAPVVAPAGADERNAASVVTPIQALANRTRYLKEILVPTAPPTRTITIDPSRAVRSDTYAAPNANWLVNGSGQMTAITNGAAIEISLDGIVPDGAVITKLEALVNPGAARVGGARMSISISERTVDWTTPLAGSSAPATAYAYDDTTTNLQVLATPAIAYTVAKSSGKLAWVTLLAGDTAASFNDVVHGIRVTFTDPGPRNY